MHLKSAVTYLYQNLYWKYFINKLHLNKDEWGIICPCGIGDTYMVCALAEEIIAQKGGTSAAIIAQEKQAAIPALFPNVIKRIIPYQVPYQGLQLRAADKFSEIRPGIPLAAHPYFFDSGTLMKCLGYKDITLLDIYKIIFDLPHTTQLARPVIRDASRERVQRTFRSLNLPIGKTVILSPEVRSLKALPISFWQKLGGKLREFGWQICINQSPSTKNQITGSKSIFYPLEDIFAFVELAGWVISIRSGLCDLIAGAGCRLDVIYPSESDSIGKAYNTYSLKKMGLSDTVLEYVFDAYPDPDYLIASILSGNHKEIKV